MQLHNTTLAVGSRATYLCVTLIMATQVTFAAQFNYNFSTIAFTGQATPGIANAAFNSFQPGQRPSLANNGDVVFEGRAFNPFSSTITSQNDNAIWAGGGANNLTLVAREDDLAPGGGANQRYNSFSFPHIDNVGGVAYGGTFRGTNVNSTNSGAIWGGPVGSVILSARQGNAAFGAGAGQNFISLSNPNLSDAGHITFAGRVNVPNSIFNRNGMWVGPANNIQKVVMDNDLAPTLGAGVQYTFVETSSGPVNNLGRISFSATGVLGGVNSTNDDGLWTSPAGGPHTLALREGNPTGISQVNFGNTLAEFTSINAQGEIITLSTLSGPGAPSNTTPSLWAGTPGSLGLIARRGFQAPDSLPGALFDFFPGGSGLARVINDNRDIGYMATLQGTENGRGVWTGNLANNPSTYDRIAFEGEPAAGFPAGVNYSALGWIDNAVGMNSLGSVMFTGLVSGPGINFNNDRGVWLYEKAWNSVMLVVREGQQIEVQPNVFRTVADINIYNGFGQNDGRYESLNDSDQLAMQLGFTDGSSGIFVASKVMIPEPSSIILILSTLCGLAIRRR